MLCSCLLERLYLTCLQRVVCKAALQACLGKQHQLFETMLYVPLVTFVLRVTFCKLTPCLKVIIQNNHGHADNEADAMSNCQIKSQRHYKQK